MTIQPNPTLQERLVAIISEGDSEYSYLVPPNQTLDVYGLQGGCYLTDPSASVLLQVIVGTTQVVYQALTEAWTPILYEGGALGFPRAFPGETIQVIVEGNDWIGGCTTTGTPRSTGLTACRWR